LWGCKLAEIKQHSEEEHRFEMSHKFYEDFEKFLEF
jgi:hypothetical protein